LAAKKLNRHYIGIEIDSKYVEIAKKRLIGCVDTQISLLDDIRGNDAYINST
jgi:DNA modification methylase